MMSTRYDESLTLERREFITVDEAVEDRPVGGEWQESSSMPERVVFLVLKAGLDWYRENTEYIDRALPFTETRERERFKRLMTSEPLRVVHGYNQATPPFPVCAILTGQEVENDSEMALGAFAGMGVDQYGDAGRDGIDLLAWSETGTYILHLYHTHPDVLIYWKELVKAILRQSQFVFARLGIDNPNYQCGDLLPDKRYIPEYIFTKWIRMTVQTRQVVAQEVRLVAYINTMVQTGSQIDQ